MRNRKKLLVKIKGLKINKEKNRSNELKLWLGLKLKYMS